MIVSNKGIFALLGLLNPIANIRAAGEAGAFMAKHRALTLEMTKKELADQYIGQVFGFVWVVGHPLFLLGLYIFIFNVVFRIKIGGTHHLPADYTIYILSGLVPWLGVQQAMVKACTALTGQANLVKQVVFPLDVLVVRSVLSSVVPEAIGLVVILIYSLFALGAPMWSYLLLPPLLVLQGIALIGISFVLSSIGVFFRDIKDFVSLFATAGIYLMPVVYLPDWMPKMLQPILYLNPFSYMVWCFQDVFFFGRVQHPWAWLVFALFAFLVFSLGYRLFRHLKSNFGNVL